MPIQNIVNPTEDAIVSLAISDDLAQPFTAAVLLMRRAVRARLPEPNTLVSTAQLSAGDLYRLKRAVDFAIDRIDAAETERARFAATGRPEFCRA